MDVKKEALEVYEKMKRYFDPNGAAFCRRVFDTPLGIYLSRLKNIGFVGLDKIVDAGCGFGQWTIALALLNKQVNAIDISSERLTYVGTLAEKVDMDNICVDWSMIEEMPFRDESMDGVFCYGVIFASDWKRTLKEFHRVLRRGGRVYLTANDLGWFLHLWKNRPNEASNYSPRAAAAQSFVNTVEYQAYGKAPRTGQIIISKEECVAEMDRLGYTHIIGDGEGKISLNDKDSAYPFFKESYDGEPGVFEVLAEKS